MFEQTRDPVADRLNTMRNVLACRGILLPDDLSASGVAQEWVRDYARVALRVFGHIPEGRAQGLSVDLVEVGGMTQRQADEFVFDVLGHLPTEPPPAKDLTRAQQYGLAWLAARANAPGQVPVVHLPPRPKCPACGHAENVHGELGCNAQVVNNNKGSPCACKAKPPFDDGPRVREPEAPKPTEPVQAKPAEEEFVIPGFEQDLAEFDKRIGWTGPPKFEGRGKFSGLVGTMKEMR